jgi:hypothetical protein
LFLGIGAVFLYFKLPYLTEGVRVEGTVVAVERRMGRRGDVFHPVVRYTAGNRTVTITGSVGASPNPYHVGEKVSVMYLRQDAGSGIIGDFTQVFLFPAIFGGIGLIGVTTAVVTAYLLARQASAPAIPSQGLSVRPI